MVTEISQNNTTQIVSLRGAITQHIHHIQVTFFSTKITPMQMLCDNEIADLMDRNYHIYSNRLFHVL